MPQINDKISAERDGDVLVVTIANPPINAGSLAVRQGIFDAIGMLASDPSLKAAVLIGGGGTFIAGSDLREFGQPLQEPQLPAVIRAIEDVPKPVVAALEGAALGGGFELALGCDARVAAAKTVVGLPEVTLGMIPGAGGTQRLPRLVGISHAIALVCSGERLTAAKALDLGIVDQVAQGDLREAAVAFARNMHAKRRLRDVAVPAEPAGAVAAARAAVLSGGHVRPNVHGAIDRVEAAAREPFDDAVARERELFQTLRMGEDAAALRYLFFAEREAARSRGPDAPEGRKVQHAIFDAYRAECEFLLEEGATPQQVDAALEAFGFALGPFAEADPDVVVLVEQLGREKGLQRRAIHDEEIVSRAVGAMVLEAQRALEAGTAARAGDIDVAMVHGYGFPRWRGGPLWWSQQRAVAKSG